MTDEGPEILVVDDNEVIADTYAQFLADQYEVASVYSGSDALDAIGPSVDVVLLDRRMPGLSGDEVLARIGERALDCRVVMVTAVDRDIDIVDLPFDEYIVKPVGRAELVEIVEEMCRRAGYDDALRQFLRLVSRKVTLEAGAEEAALEDSDAYDQIQARIAEKREELGIDTENLEDVFDGDTPDIIEQSDELVVRSE